VQFKLAILSVLATRADGRATLEELGSLVEQHALDADGHIYSALDGIDIFQSGLLIQDGNWLKITEAGRSALKTIETSAGLPPAPSLKLIDDLIGTEERQKIFGLEPRGDNSDPDSDGVEAEHAASTSDAEPPASKPIAAVAPEPMPADAPAFLVWDETGPGARAPEPEIPGRRRSSSIISVKLQQARTIWRRHLEQDAVNIRTGPRQTGNASGAAIALLTLLVIVICAGAVIALTQIRSLKSEVATLQRELSPLRERAARADLLEKAKQNAEQQKEMQDRPGADANRSAPLPRIEQAALDLTPEETRLIRDFIKPAPASATPAPAINVGDTVGIATIPLPSQLMEKIPKLLGARFTTRNGSIIILRRDSRQADFVLPPK